MRRSGVASAAPAVLLAVARTGNAQLTRGWIDHCSHGGPLVLVRFGCRIVDGVQWTRTGGRSRGRERAPRLLAERLGRRIAVGVHRI